MMLVMMVMLMMVVMVVVMVVMMVVVMMMMTIQCVLNLAREESLTDVPHLSSSLYSAIVYTLHNFFLCSIFTL